ncbi:histidine kinase [Nonlabens sp.]|uniref:histidine kinase n=1 Tax=Nonlabens sp. TaxID=1888209 RepID=UPI003F6A4FE0
MQEILGYVFIGGIVGMIVVFFLSQRDRNDLQKRRLGSLKAEQRLQQQRDLILEQLTHKLPEKTFEKEETVSKVYQAAASKNRFSLKDIEQVTKDLQNYYATTFSNEIHFKMNFPEKDQLHFEPLEVLEILTIINEGIHNAVVHAQPGFIFNIASIEHGKLSLITHDNGSGYDRKTIQDGKGIQTILKATSQLKGDLKLTSTMGNGTVVNVEIPSSLFCK